MALQTTRWSPDTCGCVVDYTWDDSVSQEARTHHYAGHVLKCSAHAPLSDEAAYAALTDENPRKNQTLQALSDAFPSITTSDALGNKVLKKDGSGPVWHFDSNRVLNVSVGSLTLAQKASVQATLDIVHGVGKVKVL